MGFFGDDSFDDLVKGFFGGSGNFQRSSISRGKMPVNQVISGKNIFFIFDFSGEENINVEVGDHLAVNNYGEEVYTGKKSLRVSNVSKKIAEYILPEKIKLKTLEYTFNNGILEVSFKR